MKTSLRVVLPPLCYPVMRKSSVSFPVALLLFGTGYLLAAITRKQGEKDPKQYKPEPFNPKSGRSIDVWEASAATRKYRKHNPKNIAANYCGRDGIETILKNEECAGVRVYKSISEKGIYGIIVVGVDKNNKDLTVDRRGTKSVMMVNSEDKCESNCDGRSRLYTG